MSNPVDRANNALVDLSGETATIIVELLAENRRLDGEREAERRRADALYIGMEHLGRQVIEDRERTEHQRDAALAALGKYGTHLPECDIAAEDWRCTCGLRLALSGELPGFGTEGAT